MVSKEDAIKDIETVAASSFQIDLSSLGSTAAAVPISGIISSTNHSNTGPVAAQAGELLRCGGSDLLPADGHAFSVPTSNTSAGSDNDPLKGETTDAIKLPLSEVDILLGGATTSGVVSTEELKGKATALFLTQFRAVVISYASGIPIVGNYIAKKYALSSPDVSATVTVTETTPLLGAIRDPKAFATQQAEGLMRRFLSPLLNRLPDVEALDNGRDRGLLFQALVESYVLMREGGGWFFTHIQEHSLVVAPTVSLGHLSTTDLAASSIGTVVANVTGYSVIQGFTGALDELLASASSRHVAKMWCARAALITGIALFVIMNLWIIHATALLVRVGQLPQVAALAGEFLQVVAIGMPGYAAGEIAKRYLTSQGLSKVHTRILSVTAPINMILNYLLVNGPIPAIRLGFVGAPLCTTLSHSIIAAVLAIYIVQRLVHEEVDQLLGQDHLSDEETMTVGNDNSDGPSYGANANEGPKPQAEELSFFDGMGELARAGISGVSKSAAQLWSKDFGGLVASILGPNALATQAILLATTSTMYQVPRSLSSASSGRMRKWVAKGDIQRAKIAASVAFVGTLGSVILISVVLLVFSSSWGALFNNDPLVLQSVSSILPIIAIYQAVYGLGAWVDSSLAALGKTALFPALNASADYVAGIPLGLYLAFWRKWGLAGLWTGLIVSLTYSCIVATTVLITMDWKKAAKGKGRTTGEGEQEIAHMVE